MTDDPSVKDVLAAVAGIPQKMGEKFLATKVPVNRAKRIGHFVVKHWLAGVLSLIILIAVSSHYITQVGKTNFMCDSPRADFVIPRQPSAAIVIVNAMAISPIAQVIAYRNLSTDYGNPDLNFDVWAFLEENKLDMSYGPVVAKAMNAEQASKFVIYERSQSVAKCLSASSGLTFFVVIGHAILSYLFLLAILPTRRKAVGTDSN